MTTLATADSLEKIQEYIQDYYLSVKKLIQVSEKEYLIEGYKNGTPYIHVNDKVIVKRDRFKHIRL